MLLPMLSIQFELKHLSSNILRRNGKAKKREPQRF